MTEHCETYLRLFDRYLDGDLDPGVTRQMEEHLAACPQCRTAQLELRATDRVLRRHVLLETEDPAREEAARERLLARLRQEPDPAWMGRDARDASSGVRRLWSGLTLRWAGGLIAATAAVILAIRLGMPPRETETREAPTRVETDLQGAAARNETREAPQAELAEREARPALPPRETPRASSPPAQTVDADAAPVDPAREAAAVTSSKGRTMEAKALRTTGSVSGAPVGRVSTEDTLTSAHDLPSRLEEEDALLSGPGGAAIEPAARALRYRLIGDLWEWLGRKRNDPAFSARALRAYEKALEADSTVAADAARVRRARQMTQGKDSEE